MKNNNENEFAAYAASVESEQQLSNIEMPANANEQKPKTSIGSAEAIESLRAQAEAKRAENEALSLEDAKQLKSEQIRNEAIKAGTTLAPVPIEDLPSKGMFYPDGTRIWISAATLADIKRWSSMDESDMEDINDKMQDILESCCKISFGSNSMVRGNWKDILDLDRLYLLFAIHDFSFPPGSNDIRVKLDEKDDVLLKKENVKYIEFSEKLMKFYNPTKKCFSFPVKKTEAFRDTDGKMDIYLPKAGVSMWVLDYMKTCEQRRDNYDKSMIQYASLLIKDWRGLNNDAYYKLIDKTLDWSAYEWSLISKIKDILSNAVTTPVMKYKDDGGIERETPLVFREGIKAIFQQSLDIDL